MIDRINFELFDKGYKEDYQRYYDQISAEKSPPFDQRLAEVERGYYARLDVIRRSGYTPMERQRLEQQELEIFQANQKEINDELEEVIQTDLAPIDQELQKLAFGRESREVAKQEMLEYEQMQEQAAATENANQMEDNSIENTELEEEQIIEESRVWEAGDLTEEFNESTPPPPPPPSMGMEAE